MSRQCSSWNITHQKILNSISSFLSLFEAPPPCIALIGVGEKLDEYLVSTLPGSRRLTIINNFSATEFENLLARPTSQIIERHAYRTIIDFLLMKLRTALDRDWLQSLPSFHQVLLILVRTHFVEPFFET